MPRCLRISEEACGAAEVDERKREQEEVRSEVMREGVGSGVQGFYKRAMRPTQY